MFEPLVLPEAKNEECQNLRNSERSKMLKIDKFMRELGAMNYSLSNCIGTLSCFISMQADEDFEYYNDMIQIAKIAIEKDIKDIKEILEKIKNSL